MLLNSDAGIMKAEKEKVSMSLGVLSWIEFSFAGGKGAEGGGGTHWAERTCCPASGNQDKPVAATMLRGMVVCSVHVCVMWNRLANARNGMPQCSRPKIK